MTTEEKYDELRIFMKRYRITWRALGEKMGLSPQGAAGICRSEACKPIYRNTLIALGFPEKLLPEPKVPVFPGLQNHADQQKTERAF